MPERSALHLLVDADLPSLERARRRLLEHFGGQPGLADSPRTVYAVELVLEEWLTNIIRHGSGRPVELQVSVDATAISLRFVDDGPPFDPSERPQPERPRSLEEAQPGGLGLFLIQRYAKSWTYARVKGRNVMLIVVELFKAPPSASPPPA